jgi:hypothetical protein
MVRAKFRVQDISKTSNGPGQTCTTIRLLPVTSGSDENKRFWQYTPAGEIKLTTTNDEAAAEFLLNQEFYIDFTPAE